MASRYFSGLIRRLWSWLHPMPHPMVLALLASALSLTVLAWNVLLHAGYGSLWIAGGMLVFLGLDWEVARQLPRRNLSFGPPAVQFAVMLLGRLFMMLALIVFLRLALFLGGADMKPVLGGGLFAIFNLVALGLGWYGSHVEPFEIRLTRLELPTPKLIPGKSLRIVHLSDLHVERITRREVSLIEQVRNLEPDLVLLTGDYIHVDHRSDPATRRQTRKVLRQLKARYGVYAITGTPCIDLPEIVHDLFADSDITLLRDCGSWLKLAEGDIYLLGVANLETRRDRQSLQTLGQKIPPEAFSIFLYHEPVMLETAAEIGIDLYLAGHTHGGQSPAIVRWLSPLFGHPLFKYMAGRYSLGPTTLYVSRGIGMEGMPVPRMRFHCHPEIVVFDIAAP